jgi:hypothetical protein
MEASEARELASAKTDEVLEGIYKSIEIAAKGHKRRLKVNVTDYEDGFVKATIIFTLEEKGYSVDIKTSWVAKELIITW